MTTLSTLKDLALSSNVMIDYSITKGDLSDVLSDTVGLSSIEQVNSKVSVDLTPYAKTSDFNDKVGLSSIDEIGEGLSISQFAQKSRIGLMYDKDAKKIFIGTDGVEGFGTEIPTDDFIKDGMIDTVSYDPDTKKLTITWNTSAGKQDTIIDLSGLVDAYKTGNGLTETKLDDGTEFKIDEDVVVTKSNTDVSSNMTLGDMFKTMATDLGHNWVEVS